jgi:hypothetical protein
MNFRVGDSVKIKQGVKDPDFDADLSGWQGTIVERIDAKHVCIEWDSDTLGKIPHGQIRTCERKGWSWRVIHLELSDVEKASRRDTQEQVNKAIEKLEEQFYWAHLGERGDRISTVLADILFSDEVGALNAWKNHLKSVMTFPLKAVVTEVQLTGPLQSGDLVTIHSFMEGSSRGLYVAVETGGDQFYFPLSDLEIHNRESAYFSPVEDYVFWFSNR